MYNNDCKPHYVVENGNSFLDEAYAVVYNIQKFQMNRTWKSVKNVQRVETDHVCIEDGSHLNRKWFGTLSDSLKNNIL